MRSSRLLNLGLVACGLIAAPYLCGQAIPSDAGTQSASAASTSLTVAAETGPVTPLAAALPEGVSGSAAPVEVATALPEAPLPQVGDPKPSGHTPGGRPVAPLKAKLIPAGWDAQPLSVRGKIAVGASDLYSFEDFAAVVLSAGYEHGLNSEPNYGVDKAAFGQRVGAAAAREASQGIFTDMVMANVLREDPRYYQLGDSSNVVHRTLYAVTRPFITRTDSGHKTVNGALLIGYAGAAALTPAYYPQSNRNFHDVASVYGGSIGGAALGFFVSEFSSDVFRALHIGHQQ